MSIGLTLIAAAMAQDITTRTLPANMPSLSIQGGQADVIIRHVPDATSSQVSVTPLTWWEGCEVAFTGSRTEAVVSILEEGEPAGRSCTAEIALSLVGDTAVSIQLARGEVSVEDMPGALSVDMTRGRVTGTPSGSTTITLRQGRVELWDLSAPVDAAVKLGRIELTYAEELAGTVAANTNIGLITARFPYGTWLDTSVSTGLGRFKRTIPSRETAATHLDAASRVGGIRVEAVVDEPAAERVAASD
jgi:hypothetical protein